MGQPSVTLCEAVLDQCGVNVRCRVSPEEEKEMCVRDLASTELRYFSISSSARRNSWSRSCPS
jgi:hypothetical protein